MTAHLNTPPGWPSPPQGWQPPAGWRPDPSWPAPPPNWQLWVEDQPSWPRWVEVPDARTRTRTATGARTTSLVAMAGGALIIAGSLLPWVSFDAAGPTIKPGVKIAAAVLGAILVGLSFAVRVAPRPGRTVAGVFAAILSGLAFLAYDGFMLLGNHGIPSTDDVGDPTTITFHPNIGIIVMVIGSILVFQGVIRALKASR
jgi:hypothetical protein